MSPSRSTHVTIDNQTDENLLLNDCDLEHGEWTEDMGPPTIVFAGTAGAFQAESAGIMTGDEGYVTYRFDPSGGAVTLNFENPWSGSNSYSENVLPIYGIERTGGGGDNASVRWRIWRL